MHKHFWDFKNRVFRCTCGACVAMIVEAELGLLRVRLAVREMGLGVEMADMLSLVEFVEGTSAEANRQARREVPLPQRHRKRSGQHRR